MTAATALTNAHDRYGLLDELRGIAAFVVLLFHIGTRIGAPVVAANGYLAVDFFFMLSGFVLAEAYGRRLTGEMTFAEFAMRRMARMMPIVVLGVCLGTTYALTRWYAAPSRSDDLPTILGSALLNGLLLPKWWHGSATGWEVFPINGPLWSLFFEIVINLIWAAWLVARRPGTLALLAILTLVSLCLLARHHGTMDLGWSGPTLAGGMARVSFGFLTGLLIHAARDRLPVLGRGAAAIAIMVTVAALALPVSDVSWVVAMTTLALPAALVLAVCSGRQSIVPGARFLGTISYAVYGLHVPFLALYSGLSERLTGRSDAGFEAYLMVPVILGVAALATTFYDRPAQRILRKALEARYRQPGVEVSPGRKSPANPVSARRLRHETADS
ncbi:peptidoglycan/LPS O-acetylase OafA/YrhL [Novosphingobium sp. PhB55]|uniref:acyltransferase family protein n=1 Tax=unclassified Novosphingobium TaxID=2644732 RepID=UPI001066E1A1|nr:acyltransferase [Novosphingobium sp. PhB55]TDW60365.1 peptidoglycan/LPS O-acetylase OafA/YrhL [Novosphingobium sp. PhB55]